MRTLSISLLIICSYTDLRERGISTRVLAAFLTSSVILMISVYIFGARFDIINRCLIYDIRAENILFSLLPGTILLMVSLISREAIGKGDVYVVFLLGFMTGFDGIVTVLFISMLSCAACGLVFITVKGKGKKDTLPYMPFLLGAYVVFLLINKRIGA